VGITQFGEHPALDQEREGLLEELKKSGFEDGRNLKVIYQNAQGDMAAATRIALRLASMYLDVVVAISTPSAQSVLSALQGKSVPLIFSAVTDPVHANLISPVGEPTEFVTGISDSLPPESQIELVKKFVPKLKTLAVIYNPAEVNADSTYEQLQKVAPRFGINVVASVVSKSSEVLAATHAVLGVVEAIYVPNDNTVASSIETVVQAGIENKLPVFAGDIGSVQKGALAMAGYDRREIGKELGRAVVKVLKGESAKNIPIGKNYRIRLVINKKTLEKMALPLPAHLPKDIRYVE
jgi:putative ABC transport system substrate-binding protein